MKRLLVFILAIASVVLSGWVFLAIAFAVGTPPGWVLALAVFLLGLAVIISMVV